MMKKVTLLAKRIFLVAGFFFTLTHPLMAQFSKEKVERKSGVERKLIEMKKIVTLSPEQEQTLRTAYTVHQQKSDSVLYRISDPTEAAIAKYQADKQLKEAVMATLTEEQQIRYHTVMGTPDVMAKTEAKMQLLRESGQYTEEELSQKQQEIFDYLMAEKIVYLRDKFNVAKQKDNIHRMKKAQPAALQESNTREKMKASGRMNNNGKVKW